MRKLMILALMLACGMALLMPAVQTADQAASSASHDYVGDKKCKLCHKEYYAAWEKTTHAEAWAKLDPAKGEDKNPKCVKCHVTGFDKGGFTLEGENKVDLKSVQCESCHGPGGDYWTMSVMKDREKSIANGLIFPITAEVCVRCHNEESPTFKGFEFESYMQKGVHKVEESD